MPLVLSKYLLAPTSNNKRFTIAAKHHQTVAELFEDNVSNLDTVILHYQTAADYFKGEESTSSANKCLVKVAEKSATMEKYEKAIQIYEKVCHLFFECYVCNPLMSFCLVLRLNGTISRSV